jgi:Asp/Glu/hydantoin racemase
VLLLNPNTNAQMTAAVAAAAAEVADAGTTLFSTTARLGVPVICSRAGVALSGHAALDAFAAFVAANPAAHLDGIVLACFGAEPACLEALREVSGGLPCTGMGEAGCLAAAAACQRFSIVTGGRAWAPMLTEYAGALGLGAQLKSVRVLVENGAEIAASPQAARENIYQAARGAVDDDGAELILLAGAGMVGQVAPLAQRLGGGVPVLDGLSPALRRIEAEIDARAAVAVGPGPAASPAAAVDAAIATTATAGLLPELELLLLASKRGGSR